MTISVSNNKPANASAGNAQTVALGIEILAIVSSHIIGAGVGFMIQQQFARTATTRVITKKELSGLISQAPYPYDMLVLEIDSSWSSDELIAILEHLRDAPVLVLNPPNAPDWSDWNVPQDKLCQLPLTASHTDYREAFTRALGIGQMEVEPPAASIETEDAAPQAKLFMRLTARQRDVLNLMLQGLSNKEIAGNLDLSPGTVKLHVSSLLKALNLRTRSQVQALASKTDGLLNMDETVGQM